MIDSARDALHQRLVQREFDGLLGDAHTAGGIALGIGIDQQSAPLRHGERGGDVHGGGRFSHAAFLICDCYDMGHKSLLASRMFCDRLLQTN